MSIYKKEWLSRSRFLGFPEFHSVGLRFFLWTFPVFPLLDVSFVLAIRLMLQGFEAIVVGLLFALVVLSD
jgi:hypothetical protein